MIGVIGILVVGPKELPHVIRAVKNSVAKLRSLWTELTDSFKEVTDEVVDSVDPEVKKIVDLEGNLQEVYDLSDFMPPPDAKTHIKSDKNT